MNDYHKTIQSLDALYKDNSTTALGINSSM